MEILETEILAPHHVQQQHSQTQSTKSEPFIHDKLQRGDSSHTQQQNQTTSIMHGGTDELLNKSR